MGFQFIDIGKKIITIEEYLYEVIFTYSRSKEEIDFTEIKKEFQIDRVFKNDEEYIFLRKVEEAIIEDIEEEKIEKIDEHETDRM